MILIFTIKFFLIMIHNNYTAIKTAQKIDDQKAALDKLMHPDEVAKKLVEVAKEMKVI